MPTEMINDWKPEVNALLKRLEENGCTLVSGDNGEDEFKFDAGKRAEFVENLIACDEAHLYVTTPERVKPKYLYLVLGNSPGELVADYVVDGTLDKVTEAHYEEWSTKPQPKCPSPYARR